MFLDFEIFVKRMRILAFSTKSSIFDKYFSNYLFFYCSFNWLFLFLSSKLEMIRDCILQKLNKNLFRQFELEQMSVKSIMIQHGSKIAFCYKNCTYQRKYRVLKKFEPSLSLLLLLENFRKKFDSHCSLLPHTIRPTVHYLVLSKASKNARKWYKRYEFDRVGGVKLF